MSDQAVVAADAPLASQIVESISTPEQLRTRIGDLEFRDGAPRLDTVERVYDNLDFLRGVDVFLNAFAGASTQAIREGFISASRCFSRQTRTPCTSSASSI